MSEYILIVDDDKRLVKKYMETLKKKNYEIGCAYNGRDGLAKLKARPADLVILDIQMPKMDGIKVLEAIRDDDSLKNTKVLVISSYAYKDSLTWWRDRFTKRRKITHAGREAYEKGEAKGGWDERIDVCAKPKQEMQEHIYFDSISRYPESKEEFQKRSEKWLLDTVDRALKSQPKSLEREKTETEPDRILIVDDEKRMVEKIASWLKPEGYELLFAYDGAEALEKIAKESIDLIILDLQMPDTTGEDVIKIMRSIPVIERIPVIVFSSIADTTGYKDLFGMAPGMEIIDENNIRSRIQEYKYTTGETYDKPEESKMLHLLHLDKPMALLKRVKKELEERRRLGHGYRQSPVTITRNKNGKWMEGYLEAYESAMGKDSWDEQECGYCQEKKRPAYMATFTYSTRYLCSDCADELKAKYPSFGKNRDAK